MSTLHKFKAYFGMVPLEDYEDDYIDEPAPVRRPARTREPARDYADVDDADGAAVWSLARRVAADTALMNAPRTPASFMPR